MTFNFYARYGLFTYSQSTGLDHWSVLDHFSSIGAECIIGKEQHADGGTHLHVFADWGRRKRFRRVDFADVSGFHPNIEPSRGTPALGYDYAIKDGDIVAGGLERPGGPENNLPRKEQVWSQILDATTRDSFFEMVRELAPSDLAKCYPSLSRYADWRYAIPEPTYDGPSFPDIRFKLEEFDELMRWCEGMRGEPDGEPGEFMNTSPPLRAPCGTTGGTSGGLRLLSLVPPSADSAHFRQRQIPCPLGANKDREDHPR
jgi:hypothetical protein